MGTATPPTAPFTTAPSVFISYRRDDTGGHVGRLYDALSAKFGPERLFVDIDHISPGQDFVQVVDDAVTRCTVLLVVMGKQWAGAGRVGKRRIDDPGDFVRLEVAGGLKRAGLKVIPVLVGGATMLSPTELPDDIRDLARRNAMELSDTRWKEDVARLVAELERVFGPTPVRSATPVAPMPRTISIPTTITLPSKVPDGIRRNWKLIGGAVGVVLLALIGRMVLGGHSTPAASAAVTAPRQVTLPTADAPRLVPSHLLSAGHDLLSSVQSWRKDAVLTQVQAVLALGATSADSFRVNYVFRSPADGAGLQVAQGVPGGPKSDRLPPAGGLAMRPLPDAVAADLPAAVQAARDSGMVGDLRSAILSSAGLAGHPGQPVWRIMSTESDHAFLVDASTGKLIHGTWVASATPNGTSNSGHGGNIFKKIGGLFKKH